MPDQKDGNKENQPTQSSNSSSTTTIASNTTSGTDTQSGSASARERQQTLVGPRRTALEELDHEYEAKGSLFYSDEGYADRAFDWPAGKAGDVKKKEGYVDTSTWMERMTKKNEAYMKEVSDWIAGRREGRRRSFQVGLRAGNRMRRRSKFMSF